MRTKSLPIQLEQDTGGAFVLQGFAGGMLTGFLFIVGTMIAFPHPTNILISWYIYPIMLATGVVGIIKSLPLGLMHHILGFRMRLPVRIATSTIGLTLFASYFAYEHYDNDPWLLAMVAGWSLLISLPTAVLVGSRVRPWEILTYWRVTFRKHGLTERLRSSAILALGGVLPLRLLSLGALGIWIVATAATWPIGEKEFSVRVLLYVVPIAYFAVSAYLTFNSPSQFVLLAIGLLINIPISYISLFGYTIFPEGYWKHETPTYLGIAYTIFISAWTAFVTTRFIVEPKDFVPENARANLVAGNQQHHDCLGSGFLEWREHAA
jgi:hypothetical protein